MVLTVEQAFQNIKSDLELSETLQDAVTTHHNAIRNWIELNDPSIKTQLIGSLQRKTRIQPCTNSDCFDMDILVVLDSFYNWLSSGGISPTDALNRLENIVSENEQYERMGPETDSPAIVLEYADNTKAELIPAYIDRIGHAPDGTPTQPAGRGYWIPKNNRWVIADYDFDTEYIIKANAASNKYLIPVVKMLKSSKRNLFSVMSSYHLEALTAQIIPAVVQHYNNIGLGITFPQLISAFFDIAKTAVLSATKIPGSKSPYADTYMTSSQKTDLSNAFGKISAFCKQVVTMSGTNAIKAWHKLFGSPFPAEA